MTVAFADAVYMFIQFTMVISEISYLYKDNFFSRASAQIVVAISTVHFFLSNYNSVYLQGVVPIFTSGKYGNIIPLALGALLFTRLIKGKGWMSSYSYAVMLGLGTGAIFTTLIQGSIISLIVSAALKPFADTDPVIQISGIIFVVGLICSLSYWLFTVEFKGKMQYIWKVGRLFLMCSIGILFAEDVLWSQSLFVGAMNMVLNFIKVVLLGMPA